MKIIVGLGNPGSRYQATRHNLGYQVVDLLAEQPGTSRGQSRFEAQVSEQSSDEGKVLLVKPETFMNLSGRCVRQMVDYYDVPLHDVLIVCDDVNLPLGKLRFRARGSHGGHNGLRDIQNHVGTTAYPRLRLGVGAPQDDEMVDHVLGRFRPSERLVIDAMLETAVQAVDYWLRHGTAKSMNEYNG
jgi:PTH1 family peptidyl-tRNA hydrolase